MIAIKGLIMMSQIREQFLARHPGIAVGKLVHLTTCLEG